VKSCAEIRPLIGAHLLGALDDDETTVLFTHLAHCQECAAKHSRLSQLMPLIDLAGSSEAPVGLGEPGTTVVGPAIGNAIFRACGARVRDLPIRPAAVKAAMKV